MLHDIFVLGNRLGIGATAEVFAATHRVSGEKRALKVFTPLVLSDPDTVKRIETEVAVLQSLQHPNIVRIFGAHSDGGELALELELVDGGDLRAWRRGYQLRLTEPLLWILAQIARGIGCAHENGVLHRDLKPENVLVSRTGDVKLSDFGLARQLDAVTMTKSGLLAGSIGYMAPEMLDGERCTPASDVFSFGAVAYELLSGVNPFAGPNPQSMMKKMLHGEFRPLGELVPGIPARVETLVRSCLALRAAERPASIWHVEAELLSTLSLSPLHKTCRILVGADNAAAIEPAFREKLRLFEERRAALCGSKADAIALARDWGYVFPDSAVPAEILAALPGQEKPPLWLRAGALLALLTFLGAGVALFRMAMKPAPTTAPASPASAPVAAHASVATDALATRAASPDLPLKSADGTSPARQPSPKPPRQGWIRVEADDDVKLLLDGEEVPPDAWKHIPADPGRRHIKLVKQGYLPIENVITVQPGKMAVVRAKGGG